VTAPAIPSALRPRRPLAARVLPSSLFYGWWITLGCGLVLLVCVGIGFYVLPIFLGPLQDEHGWSNLAVSGATGLYFSVSGLTSATIGPIVDRRGPIGFLAAGTVLLGLSLAAVGLVSELWQLYLVYVVMAVAFSMASNVGTTSIMTRWWIHRRAQAMSVAFSFISVGGAVFAPIGTGLIESGGISRAAPVLGTVVVAVALPVTLVVLVWDPAQMGLQPDNGTAPAPRRFHVDLASQYRTWTRAQAARTRPFWAMMIGFMVVLLCQVGFLAHQVAFLTERFDSAAVGATAIGTAAIGSAVARLVVGTFADNVDKRLLTVILVLAQAASVFALVLTDNLLANYALVLVFGFTMGNIFMMQSLLVGEIFGIPSFGSIFGITAAASQVAGGVGPVLVGALESWSGGYTTPFVVTAAMTALASLVLLEARPLS